MRDAHSSIMDSQQYLKYGLTSAEVSYEHSTKTNPAYSQCSYGSFNLALGNSPKSPLSSQFEGDTSSSMLSNCHKQHNATKASSNVSPSSYSKLEVDSTISHQLFVPESIQVDPSPLCASSCQSMQHTLQEIETVLMAPDSDAPTTSTNPELAKASSLIQSTNVRSRLTNLSGEIHLKKQIMMESHSNDVKHLLFRCAQSLFENNVEEFKMLVEETRAIVSISGEPVQRLGAYMLESLVARHQCTGTNIYRTLRCRQPESKELLSYMRILYEICPYMKFGYMAANGAIAEALKDEDRIHIIDFQIAQGTQWITLLQALAARPGGPPHVRITGIDDPVSEYARGDGLQIVGDILHNLAIKFNIPLEFTALPADGRQVTKEMLDIRPGEAVAVNFTLQLHHIPDESVDVNNPRDELLRMVKGLSPKVTTLVEQESNTNTTPFLTRFMETLEYYSALFESIDVMMPREDKDRISVEQHCLAKDIVNIIACEGTERVERHELLGKWQSRLTMAGFKPFPLSPYVNSVIRTLLGYYSDKYTLVEKDGAMLLGWKKRNLISASAWH